MRTNSGNDVPRKCRSGSEGVGPGLSGLPITASVTSVTKTTYTTGTSLFTFNTPE